jgi:hypothetical protein
MGFGPVFIFILGLAVWIALMFFGIQYYKKNKNKSAQDIADEQAAEAALDKEEKG